MMKGLAGAALAAALVASSCEGISLREHIEQDLSLTGKSYADNMEKDLLKWTGKCMPQAVKKEDRMCEPTAGVANKKNVARCTDCSQTCHVWGDPHMATFLSPCTINVFTDPGRYTMWEWVAYKAENTISIEVEVEKKQSDIGNKPWIQRAYLNGELMLSASECDNKSPVFTNTIPMSSDVARPDGVQDMSIEYYMGCRRKHSVWALEIWIKVHDDGSPDSDKLTGDMAMFPYNASTRMLANDRGACVDWLTYGKNEQLTQPELGIKSKESAEGFNCDRQSNVNSDYGRVCQCTAECAVWGDPHVNSFYVPPSRSNSKNFLMPKPDGRTYAQTVLYSLGNKVAVMVEMDACDFIAVARMYVIKDSCLKSINGCGSKAMSTDWLDSNCYDSYTLNAEEMCTYPEDMDYKTRKTILFPSPTDNSLGAKYYDEAVNGYNLGLGGVVDGLLYPVKSSGNINSCVKGAGASSDAEYKVKLGGFRAVLKCHITQAQGPYFNVCIQRDHMQQENLNSAGTATGVTNDESVQNMELYARSSGWCATGDYTNGGQAATMSASTFTYRVAGTTNTFVLASDDVAGTE